MGELRQYWETTCGDKFSDKNEALEYQKELDRVYKVAEEIEDLAESLENSVLNTYTIDFNTTSMAIEIVEFFNDRYRFIVPEIEQE